MNNVLVAIGMFTLGFLIGILMIIKDCQIESNKLNKKIEELESTLETCHMKGMP
jgi:hypothetical protein